MRAGLAILIAAGLLLALALWLRPPAPPSAEEPAPDAALAPVPALPTAEATGIPQATPTPLDRLNQTGSPEEDVRLLADVFIHYQRMVKEPGGNPVGLNVEITRALTGRNRGGLAFIASNHPAISAEGELCDRWGRPYFFHALSGRRMQVRSSGVDRRMWTGDDVVFPVEPPVTSEAEPAP